MRRLAAAFGALLLATTTAQAQLFPLQGAPQAVPGVANTIVLSDASGVGETNYPFQFGRPFLQGAIPHAPQVLINGQPVAAQADVKNRYPDGSVEFAVVAVVIPSIPPNGSVTLTFQDTTDTSAPLSQSMMQTLLPVGAMVMSLTGPAAGALPQTVDAGQMLEAGNCTPWTSGQVAQTMMCADDSAARKYDIGFGDGYHPFRPRFYATFWPATSQVYVRVVGENGLTTELEDIAYKLAITSNGATLYTKDLSGDTTIGANKQPLIHWSGGEWTKEFWLGGAPKQQVTIDNNLPYLESTRFIPNFDTSVKLSAATIASYYSSYTATPAVNDIYGLGGFPFGMVPAMGTAGSSDHIGVFPGVIAKWLLNQDWRMRYIALTQTDLAVAWPLGYRESDPTRIFQRGDVAGSGTGLGRAVSIAGRPTYGNKTGDDVTVVGPRLIGFQLAFSADTQHQPSFFFAPYVLTGDPWYLQMLYSWAGMSAFIDAPSPPYVCIKQITNCSNYRGPTGAYGGLFGFSAARDIAWTLRGRAETAFIAPDGTPEKSYFTYMTNDAIAKWEGGLGITGTAFDTSTIKQWVKKTDFPYPWSNLGPPPLGSMASICSATAVPPLCGYSAATQVNGFGLAAGVNGSFDNPWMNYYLEYGVGRAVELGFPMQQIQAQLEKLPIGMISSSDPYLLGAYAIGVQKAGGGFWPDWPSVIAGSDPTYNARLKTDWVSNIGGSRQSWVQPGLAMAVDQSVSGASSAWAWFFANGYTTAKADAKWAVVPRTDANVLPAQPTTTPP